jgi:hypothetical protein
MIETNMCHKQKECCVCRDITKICVTCTTCKEGQYCEACCLTMAENGQLQKCPVCRSAGWRRELFPLNVILHQEPVAALGNSPAVGPRRERVTDISVTELANECLDILAACGEEAFKIYKLATKILVGIFITWLVGVITLMCFLGPRAEHDPNALTWGALLAGTVVNCVLMCLCQCASNGEFLQTMCSASTRFTDR